MLSEPQGILEYVSYGLCHSWLIAMTVAKIKCISANKELDSDVNKTHSEVARKQNLCVGVPGIVDRDEVELMQFGLFY